MSETCLSNDCGNFLSGPLGQTFTSTLQLLFTAQCLIKPDWPADSSDNITDLNFDYIVVGAGAAGAVVASRLSEDDCRRVLLVEAGGDPPLESISPQNYAALQSTQYDWRYISENDKIICQGFVDGKCRLPAGKMLGGTTSFNNMIYCRGNRQDYDDLEAAGNIGWNYDEVLKYFKKSENMSDSFIQNSPIYSSYHNYSGPLGVSYHNKSRPIEDTIIQSYLDIGYSYNYDVNGPTQYGVSKMASTIKGGERSSTATAFLIPARFRSNLVLLKNAMAIKILFNGKVAIGVTIRLKNGTDISAYASKEVIVSAGVVRTPQLLMLSGIGPRKHLEQFNIPVIADLQVGQNLRDNIAVPVLTKLHVERQPILEKQPLVDVAQYIANRTGFYSYQSAIGSIIDSFINSDKSKVLSEPPNLQIRHSVQRINQTSFYTGCILNTGYTKEICDSIFSYNKENPIFIIYVQLIDNYSRGNISLGGLDPIAQPKIYPRYFSDTRDVEILLNGINDIMTLLNTPSLKSIGAEVQRINIPECNCFEFLSRDYWVCIIYQLAASAYHLKGTAKMGPISDKNAVVNPQLQVYGVTNLRVIDASIFPGNIRGNTMAPTIMVAEKGSDLIKEFHKNDICL